MPVGKSLCTSCGTFNLGEGDTSRVVRLSDVSKRHVRLVSTGPWDQCFGAGKNPETGTPIFGVAMVANYLLSGPPGSGKSTLTLQVCDSFADAFDRDTLLVGAEEDTEQMRERADRMGLKHVDRMLVLPIDKNSGISSLSAALKEYNPCFVVVDSLSSLFRRDPTGAVLFAHECKQHTTAAKIAFFLLNHVTKTDDFAGLMDLQHEVDATLTMYPVEDLTRPTDAEPPRVLRSLKNRFGKVTAIRFEMTEGGLMRSKVQKPEKDMK